MCRWAASGSSYNGAGEEQSQPADAKAGGNTITLQGDWSVKFTGLPAGTGYEVTEQSYADLGFEPAVIAYVTDADADHEVEQGDEDEVTVTNTRNVGSLTITKEVEGNNLPASDTFTFTVTLENNSLPVNKQYGDYTFAAETTTAGENPHKATATIGLEALEDGDSVTLTGIPVGTAYTVVGRRPHRRWLRDLCGHDQDGYRQRYHHACGCPEGGGVHQRALCRQCDHFQGHRGRGRAGGRRIHLRDRLQQQPWHDAGRLLPGHHQRHGHHRRRGRLRESFRYPQGRESITIENIPTTKDGTGTTYTVTEWMDVDGDGSKEALTEGILYANGYVMTTTGATMNAASNPTAPAKSPSPTPAMPAT